MPTKFKRKQQVSNLNGWLFYPLHLQHKIQKKIARHARDTVDLRILPYPVTCNKIQKKIASQNGDLMRTAVLLGITKFKRKQQVHFCLNFLDFLVAYLQNSKENSKSQWITASNSSGTGANTQNSKENSKLAASLAISTRFCLS